MAFVTGTFTGIVWTVYVATVNPTVGAAIVAAITTIAQTSIVLWHDRRMERRVSARRLVAVKGTPDNPEAVIVANEERRELELENNKEEPTHDGPKHTGTTPHPRRRKSGG